jgi:2-keto-3-deoxy-L-rhamnonate aldolase RhmA
MGHVGQFTHTEVMQTMADAAQRCKALGKPVGTIGATPEVVTQYRAMGYDYLAISSDMGLLMSGALAAVKSLRGMSDEPHVHSLQTGTQTEA